jgi:hypothetical protein
VCEYVDWIQLAGGFLRPRKWKRVEALSV